MNNWSIEVPDDLVPSEGLSTTERSFLIARLTEQFTTEAAIELYDIGAVEEKDALVQPPAPEGESARLKIDLVRSAAADWQCFSRSSQLSLDSAIRILESQAGQGASVVPLPRPQGRVLRHDPLRIVYRLYADENRVVIYAIGCWAINPLAKVWRYFDQRKAVDLLARRELYLRRLDLLTDKFEGDPYEGNPTFGMFDRYKRIYRQHVDPSATDEYLRRRFEHERRATFVSCWQKSETESWLMWKEYCKRGGGFALQTTQRRLNHLFQALRKSHDDLYLRSVTYIDHWSDDSLPCEVPIQVFCKPTWFSEEREIRLVRFRGECAYAGTDEGCEAALGQLKDHDRLPADLTDLAEKIVLNPFSADKDRKAIIDLLGSKLPSLEARLQESRISKRPVLWPSTTGSGQISSPA